MENIRTFRNHIHGFRVIMNHQVSLNRLLAMTATAGFLFLTVDTLIEHWPVFSTEPMSFIPVLFGLAACGIGGITIIRWNETWIQRLHLVLFAAFVVALLGLYFHIVDPDDKVRSTSGKPDEEKEKSGPPLAPLAFGAVAVVGLLGTARKWHAEVVEPSE